MFPDNPHNAAATTDEGFHPCVRHLLSYTNGRPHATTAEYAHLVGRSEQTIRKNYCLCGNAFGIVPTKIGNRLLWPIEDIAQLFITGGLK